MESKYSEPKALGFWLREYNRVNQDDLDTLNKAIERKCLKKSKNK